MPCQHPPYHRMQLKVEERLHTMVTTALSRAASCRTAVRACPTLVRNDTPARCPTKRSISMARFDACMVLGMKQSPPPSWSSSSEFGVSQNSEMASGRTKRSSTARWMASLEQ